MGNASRININLYTVLSSWLILIGTWTIVIKFIFPIIYSLVYQQIITANIMWDFWWIAHFWLAYSFINPSRKTFIIGMIITVSELLIIIYKLLLFFSNPIWDIWQTNWMINKLFVLFTFLVIFALLLKDKKKLLGIIKVKFNG